ncbi:MAG: CCA tRNA nucleotidyltransferase [Ruminococcaceae bacterium]|nr:CCA tRNA nucleotidyltransferase [Oscillospiraceae bacterium]
MKINNNSDFKIELPKYIKSLIDLLNSKGYEAYAVGGCVRDCVMGRLPNDFDMTTNATPDEMLTVFCEYKVIETGLKHGTLTVISENIPVEITTYRVDGEYHDSRHPDKVYFTRNLKDDVSRRDFTVNAMAYNDKTGIVDFYGGIDDIKKKLIMAVGDADKRFKEDALRIIRALRFASVLGFDIEEKTAFAASENAELLKNISAERINVELKKLLLGKNAIKILKEHSDILAFVSPEMFSSCTEKLKKLSTAPDDVNVFFAFLLTDSTEKEANEALSRLKFSNAERKEITELLSLQKKDIPKNKIEMKFFISETYIELIPKYFMLLSALGKGTSSAEKYYAEIRDNKECVYISDLKVNGNDLSKTGISKGEKIGQALKFLLRAVISGEVENKKEELLEFAKNNFLE